MKREIKFRAWNPIESKLEYWTLNDLCYHQPNRPDICLQNWQQFTGPKDKNGKEIYEGDILIDDEYPEEGISFGKVEWGNSGWVVDPWFTVDEFDEYATTHEVVGNIYENPELLSESN